MNIASVIDHTGLKPQLRKHDIIQLCGEAIDYKFASVCVNATWVDVAAGILADSEVNVCAVIGFPFGASTPEAKAFEAASAIARGANEVDMVINIGAILDKDIMLVERDIRAVVDAAKGALAVKVIIETVFLTDAQKVLACELAMGTGANYVKTCTGFSGGAATIADIELMRKTVGSKLGVKASGGIRSAADVEALINAGATRIGTSSGVDIIKGLISQKDY